MIIIFYYETIIVLSMYRFIDLLPVSSRLLRIA